MIKVKITVGWHRDKPGTPPYRDNLSIFNFTNSQDNIFNGKKYYINSEIENPDFWFILENTKSNRIENVNISKSKIYFLNSETRYEPSYFMRPSKEKFLNQFDKIYSPNFINLENIINVPPFLSWRLRGDPFTDFSSISDLDFYSQFNPKKEKLLSVYCTTKQITEIQKVRLDFVTKLKNIFGDDMDVLVNTGKEIESVLSNIPGASDVRIEQVTGLPIMTIMPNREIIARYGLNVADVQKAIQTAMGGKISGQIFEGDRRFDLVVRLPETLRQDPDMLRQLPIPLPEAK